MVRHVHMDAIRARAVAIAQETGKGYHEVKLDLLAAHDRAKVPVIRTREASAPPMVKRFYPDGRVEVSALAPSFAETVRLQM